MLGKAGDATWKNNSHMGLTELCPICVSFPKINKEFEQRLSKLEDKLAEARV